MNYKEMAKLVYQGHYVLDARTVEFSENEFVEIIMKTVIQTAVDDYDKFIEELYVSPEELEYFYNAKLENIQSFGPTWIDIDEDELPF